MLCNYLLNGVPYRNGLKLFFWVGFARLFWGRNRAPPGARTQKRIKIWTLSESDHSDLAVTSKGTVSDLPSRRIDKMTMMTRRGNGNENMFTGIGTNMIMLHSGGHDDLIVVVCDRDDPG